MYLDDSLHPIHHVTKSHFSQEELVTWGLFEGVLTNGPSFESLFHYCLKFFKLKLFSLDNIHL